MDAPKNTQFRSLGLAGAPALDAQADARRRTREAVQGGGRRRR
jgi:hypothetical protein